LILFKTFTITVLIFTLLGICHAQDNDNINLPIDQKKENNTKTKTEEFTAPVLSSKEGIDKIGVELTELIDSIALAEIDQPSRLPIRPIVLKALASIVNVPEYNLELKMLALTKAQKDEAVAGLYPQISASTSAGLKEYDFGSATYSGSAKNFSITGRQLIHDFGATSSSIASLDKKVSQAELKFEETRNNFLEKSFAAFYEVQRALMLVRLARENLQARKSFVSYIKQREDLGASSQADVVRADSRVADGLDILAGAMKQLAVAKSNYRLLFNAEAEPYVIAQELMITELQENDFESILEKHISIVQQNTAIEALEKEIESQQARLLGGIYFELGATTNYDPGRPEQKNNQAMITFRNELYTGGAKTARIVQAQQRRVAAIDERTRIKLELSRALNQNKSDLDGLAAAVSARLLLYQAAKSSYMISKDLYSFSRGSVFDVFKTQEDLYSAGQRLIESLTDRAQAKVRLVNLSKNFHPYLNSVYDIK
jgi:outer membrane protein TolC